MTYIDDIVTSNMDRSIYKIFSNAGE